MAAVKNSFNSEVSKKEKEDFFLAVKDGDNVAVGAFIKKHKGVISLKRDVDGHTALILAIEKGHRDTVELLLENGASSSEGLPWAAGSGYKDIVKQLLDWGADINARDTYGWTALMTAAHTGHNEIIELLLDYGADIDVCAESGATALKCAQKFGMAGYAQASTIELLEQAQQPGKQKERLARQQERLFKEADCSRGLRHAVPAAPLLSFSKKRRTP